MIRLVQRKLIIPRGDTGSFSVPVLPTSNMGDAAVFTIFSLATHKKIYEKVVEATANILTIRFTHEDTVNLPTGKFVWDIKFYQNPVFADGELVSGDEVDSYYAAFSLPECEIRMTGDKLLTSEDSPATTLTSESLNVLNAAISEATRMKNDAAASAEAAAAILSQITGLSADAISLQPQDSASASYDAETGVLTIGVPRGIGIAGVTLNNDYTLTLTLDDGTSFTTASIRGEPGSEYTVLVQADQPTQPENKLWIPTNAGVVQQVPTVSEMNAAIAAAITGKTSIHICTSAEYDATTRVPTVQNPEENVFYLVPTENGSSPDLYTEWIYSNSNWEMFGSATIDLSGYATKADTVLTTTLSKGRKTNTTVGSGSLAFGRNVEASGECSQAEGREVTASGPYSHAEGWGSIASGYTSHAENGGIASGNASHAEGSETTASGSVSHSEGSNTQAIGGVSHAEGYQTQATGTESHAEGEGTQAIGAVSHAEGQNTQARGIVSHSEGLGTIAAHDYARVSGKYNIVDDYNTWPEWTANTSYAVGDRVKYITTVNNETAMHGYTCKKAHTSSTNFQSGNWTYVALGAYASMVGNGTADNARSNAYGLTWEGDGYYAGDLYVHANANSTGGVKVATIEDMPVENGSGIGSVKTKDFEYNETVYSNKASGRGSFAEGISTQATGISSHAEGGLTRATGNAGSHAEGASTMAAGTSSHAEGASTIAVNARSHAEGLGTYAQGLEQHVQGRWNVLDVGEGIYADIIGNGTAADARSNAYALDWSGNGHFMGDVYVGANADSSGGTMLVKDVQVNGTSVVTDGVANVPLGSESTYGVYKMSGANGIWSSTDGKLAILRAYSGHVQTGTELSRPIVPECQHLAAFYGLAKAAGADMKNVSGAIVGVYPEAQKSAIHEMFNSPVTVTGTTPTITALPGVRYVCGEVATLDIVLPESGIVDVTFACGSTPTVLTITPATGRSVIWANGFDPSALEAWKVYEINIMDGLGVAGIWN